MLAAACSTPPGATRPFRPLVVGDRAPAYAARTLAGDSVRVGAGTPVLLNVWATWCTSCREEMADLAALDREYAPRGVRVLAVSVDAGDGTRVRRFAEAEQLPFAVAHDPAGVVQKRLSRRWGCRRPISSPATDGCCGCGAADLHGAPAAVRATLDSAVKGGT